MTKTPTTKPEVDWNEVDRVLSSGEDLPPPSFALFAPNVLTEQEAKRLIFGSKWRFYVYMLCALDGQVFYVGKGTYGRMFQHRDDAACGQQSDKAEMVRRLGDDLRYAIFAMFDDEDTALFHESLLIDANWRLLLNVKRETPRSVITGAYRRMMRAIAEDRFALSTAFDALARKAHADAALHAKKGAVGSYADAVSWVEDENRTC